MFCFEIKACLKLTHTVKDKLELLSFLPLPLKFQDYRYIPPCPVTATADLYLCEIYIYISISIYKFTSVYLCVCAFTLMFFEIHEDADAGCSE